MFKVKNEVSSTNEFCSYIFRFFKKSITYFRVGLHEFMYTTCLQIPTGPRSPEVGLQMDVGVLWVPCRYWEPEPGLHKSSEYFKLRAISLASSMFYILMHYLEHPQELYNNACHMIGFLIIFNKNSNRSPIKYCSVV